MMLRSVHVAERQHHHLLNDFHRVLRCLRQAQTDYRVHSCRVAFIADVVAVDAPGLTVLFLMTNRAFHEFVRLKILQGCFANQTFFFHFDTSFSIPVY